MWSWGAHRVSTCSTLLQGKSLLSAPSQRARDTPELPTARLPCTLTNSQRSRAAEGPGSHRRAGDTRGAGPLGAAPTAWGSPGPPKADVLLFAGPCPIETSGTRSHFAVTDFPEESSWSAVIQQQDGDSLSVSLCSPPSARIGRYHLTLETSTGYQGSSCHLGEFVLLFNAWHPGEVVTSRQQGFQ